MDHDEKFWLGLIVGVLLAITLDVFSGYLNDKHEQVYVEQGLQPYNVSTCSAITTRTEWHEAGWNKPTETKSLTILTH